MIFAHCKSLINKYDHIHNFVEMEGCEHIKYMVCSQCQKVVTCQCNSGKKMKDKKKRTSCGVLVKYGGKYVLGHATGQNHYDMFKGGMESGETIIQTALRECEEESGLIFQEKDLHFISHTDYTSKKDLVIYVAKIDSLNLADLKCTTFIKGSTDRLEMDYYALMDFDEMLAKVGKSMSALFAERRSQIEAI